jgi:hypothetical protein
MTRAPTLVVKERRDLFLVCRKVAGASCFYPTGYLHDENSTALFKHETTPQKAIVHQGKKYLVVHRDENSGLYGVHATCVSMTAAETFL